MMRIEETKVPWEKSVVMICSKCGIQFDDLQLSTSPERIKTELKAKTKNELGSLHARIITTSCLNICPENKISIVMASSDEKIFKAYNVNPNISGTEVFETLFKK
jgi:C4-type Zn-finger protein